MMIYLMVMVLLASGLAFKSVSPIMRRAAIKKAQISEMKMFGGEALVQSSLMVADTSAFVYPLAISVFTMVPFLLYQQ